MAEIERATSERTLELKESLSDVRDRVKRAASAQVQDLSFPTLVAVSKYKPASDILACYEHGQQEDFGENYVQELVDKAQLLPHELRWHFIGTLQSNKAKTLASIPNLYSIQTLTSAKAATALNKSLPPERQTPLKVLIQVNTSGEDSKSGLAPLNPVDPTAHRAAELTQLAIHVITTCPRLHLQGLMTIGSLDQSLSTSDENQDFENLKKTRDALHNVLSQEIGPDAAQGNWGEKNETGHVRLLLSMGMSSDFEAAIKSGGDIVRVGTGIFGARHKKGEGV